jgi:hypothetical protein
MKHNESLQLSISFREALSQDLSSAFIDLYPKELVSTYIRDKKLKVRKTVFTLENTLLTMLLTAQHEDKSLQQSVNLFKIQYEKESRKIQALEAHQIAKSRELMLSVCKKKSGRPPEFKSKLSKSITKEVSSETAAYSIARKRLPIGLIQTLFEHLKTFDDQEKEQWYGMNTYIADGTYLQLQDTKEIRKKYPLLKGEGNYPQALLEVLIRQGSGQITDYAVSGRDTSELTLIPAMLKRLPDFSLLLADDLYNTYHNFCIMQEQNLHIIVPGKRDRNFTIIEQISDRDHIVEVKTIKETSIVEKYEKRWDIEICIREIKTLMDINVLRGKSCDMLEKELLVALIAYNFIRKIISISAQKADIPPQRNIFQERFTANSSVFTDKRGRVFCKKSTGRPRCFN